MRDLKMSEQCLVTGGSDNPGQAIAGGGLIAGSYAGAGIVGGTGTAAAGAGSVGCIPPVGLGLAALTGGILVGDYLEDAHGVGTTIGNIGGTIYGTLLYGDWKFMDFVPGAAN